MSEFNLIQAPELIRRLTKLFGMRQAHITPTLSESVQPVVLLSDVTREPEYLPRTFGASGAVDGDSATLGYGMRLENPTTSGIVARITRITVSLFGTTVVGGDAMWIEIVPVTSLPLSNVINTVRGKDFRKGIGSLTGIAVPDQPSTLFLTTGTSNAAVGNLNHWGRAFESFPVGNVAASGDRVASLDVDLTPFAIFLQPGFALYSFGKDPAPAGIASLQWEERLIL